MLDVGFVAVPLHDDAVDSQRWHDIGGVLECHVGLVKDRRGKSSKLTDGVVFDGVHVTVDESKGCLRVADVIGRDLGKQLCRLQQVFSRWIHGKDVLSGIVLLEGDCDLGIAEGNETLRDWFGGVHIVFFFVFLDRDIGILDRLGRILLIRLGDQLEGDEADFGLQSLIFNVVRPV